ncbi:MAG TPA: ABC transporter ATP-binding protein [Anaerolineae bacterium]|nr:ABC transporter ATP-binding protein [Anaerolineae bacterium]
MEKPLLEISGVTMTFGGLMALNDVSSRVYPQQIKGIIGPNGAGKTTLFNVVTGIYRPTAGDIRLKGESLVGLKPNEVAGKGIARTFQTIRLFGGMTALENVMLGRHLRTRAGFVSAGLRLPRARREEQASRAEALRLLELVGLADKADEDAVNLPFGMQRTLEIARALASRPSVLILDEPASGLNLTERQSLAALIRQLRDDGATIVLVEHDMDLVMDLVDDILVLVYGTRLAEGPPQEIQENEAVIAAYLGN